MSVWLLANVGNSDLEIDRNLLPNPPASQDARAYWTPRRVGEYVRENPDRFAGNIRLPLLGPTLEWLLEHESISTGDLRLVLFASDQPKDVTLESEWLKDTYPVAEAIRTLIAKGLLKSSAGKPLQIPDKQIRLAKIEGSPADYSNMLHFYAQKLPEVAQKVEASDRIFLEVSGGTPAMASMLIVMGVEVFGERARTLYVERGAKVPYEVNVARELFARKTRDVLRTQVELHAYAIAHRTLEDAETLVTADANRRALMAALLRYADRRLSFDFDRAHDALQEASRLAVGEAQAHIRHWLREMEQPDTADQVLELIYSATIKLGFGDYADFVQRIFRFQEAMFRHIAQQMGVEFSDDSQKYIKREWLEKQSALDKHLKAYQNPQTKRTETVDVNRPLNRYSLGAIVDYFIRVDKWKKWHGAVTRLHRLSAVADLRNKGVAGHGFDGIGEEDITQAYGGTPDVLLQDLRATYQDVFGHEPGANPYDAINDLILKLIQS